MEALQQKIGYTFRNRDLLTEAMSHSSYGYENDCPYNERLEFLGDAILGYVISRELFLQFPQEPEGTLSKLKSVLVSAHTLTKKARLINLGSSLRLGKGERKGGGHQKSSILTDAMESLIGAIALDGGLEAADRFILSLFREDIKNASIEIKNAVDFKTLLQERLQEQSLGLPNYVVTREEGPAHDRRFLVRVEVGNYKGPIGTGTSKKNAQQECAKLLLEDKDFWEDCKTQGSPASRR